jgi:hypothetical protein
MAEEIRGPRVLTCFVSYESKETRCMEDFSGYVRSIAYKVFYAKLPYIPTSSGDDASRLDCHVYIASIQFSSNRRRRAIRWTPKKFRALEWLIGCCFSATMDLLTLG